MRVQLPDALESHLPSIAQAKEKNTEEEEDRHGEEEAAGDKISGKIF